ncbi:MAG: TrmH family RNA methyltransferase [Treponema sp.]|nr:TrmH family RNA methyltransferase [Treponema sp.]
MIEPHKLFQLDGGHRRRKLALTFGALERDIAGIAETGSEYAFPTLSREDYVKQLAKIVLRDPKISDAHAAQVRAALAETPCNERRICNTARNAVLAILGTFPAEWDLVIAPHVPAGGAVATVAARHFFPGVIVYAEDIRSPFNVGSIFRTAEALGAESVLLSPLCTDPLQPRALRSGMGCIQTMRWERCTLDALSPAVPVFALETGGIPIDEFAFPPSGICIVGSEELGISPEALARVTAGCVSIPMKGLKASLNVGVAFGILMHRWVTAIAAAADKS